MRAKFYKIHGEYLQNVLTGFSESCPNFILSKEISKSKLKGHKKLSFTAVQNREQNYSFIFVEVYSYPTPVSQLSFNYNKRRTKYSIHVWALCQSFFPGTEQSGDAVNVKL
jgi:hypothetical protein